MVQKVITLTEVSDTSPMISRSRGIGERQGQRGEPSDNFNHFIEVRELLNHHKYSNLCLRLVTRFNCENPAKASLMSTDNPYETIQERQGRDVCDIKYSDCPQVP